MYVRSSCGYDRRKMHSRKLQNTYKLGLNLKWHILFRIIPRLIPRLIPRRRLARWRGRRVRIRPHVISEPREMIVPFSRAFCLPNDLGLIIKVPNDRGILMEKSSTNWLFQCQGEANVDQRTVRILRKHECSYEYSYEYSTVRLYRSTVLYGCTGVQYCTVVRVQYSCRSS